MKANMGKIDKIIRIILGLAIIVIGVILENLVGAILGVVGIILLISVYFSFCPLYRIFGICTNKNDKDSGCATGCGCGK